jgi:predicted transcriptional regulator with HTH domain
MISNIVMMILRVYAMWKCSKWILYALLFIYVPQVMVSCIFTGIYDDPSTFLQGMSGAKMQSHAGGPSSHPFL